MALAPLAYVLYTRIMKHNPRDPDWPDRDRFVLSAGHASMLLYSTLFLTGYDITLDDIKQFRQLGLEDSRPPRAADTPGVEVTTGPLGQGISHAVGMALAERMLAARFNRPRHDIVDHHTFVIGSDGDMQEGICGGGLLARGTPRARSADRLLRQQPHPARGPHVESPSPRTSALRYEAYGWHVQDLGEDMSLERLESATRTAMDEEERPSLIMVRTHIGYGSPHKQDTAGRARLAAGRGGGQAHQGGVRVGSGQAVLRPRRGAPAFPPMCRSRRGAARPTGGSGSTPTREEHPELASEFRAADRTASSPPAGTPKCPSFTPPGRWPRPASPPTRCCSGRQRRSLSSSVARPISRPRRSTASMTPATSRRAPTTAATCTSVSASTRWAPSSMA